ncbi:MAG TPA: RDD family protein [Chitinophagaceae bacterium]|nr:RDD family protein [Chitinophagaceae bacterium]
MEYNGNPLDEKPTAQLVQAGYGKRFINYCVDFLLFCMLASFMLLLLRPVYPLADKIMSRQPISFPEQMMMTFFYGLYISLMETVLKGKSVGKFITGTRAVGINGLPVNGQLAFLRGLIRMIPFPFEQVSALSFSVQPTTLLPPYPWHDRWSRTLVIDESKSVLPKE